ncbi:spore coat protein U domain-containing protein [Deinococcus aquiradiocola]|uniref:Spore coat protein U/FanG domain-containing protein n=1 Tax=Deinococcus aquiradiocola TaxID=393059 RepID=A0A917UQR2_9DEIO|nr:spore coat protein U domain-containing protein [Deinococcus aquiradiocola]GGJ78162.1 hypothetical protein GCM10008939_22650 [Deinococcus aquiradiocola]
MTEAASPHPPRDRTARRGARHVAGLLTALLLSAAGALGTCTVGSATLSFGTYTSRTGASASGALTVTCTALTPYSLTLDNGMNFSVTRRMKASVAGGTYYLPYTVTIPLPTGVGSGSAASVAVTGTAPAGTNVPPGTYQDTLTLTVSF